MILQLSTNYQFLVLHTLFQSAKPPATHPLRRCGLNASGGKFITDSDERVRCRSMAWCMAAGCNMGGLWTGVPGDKMMIFVVGRELYKWPKWRWSTSQHMHCQLLMFFLWSEEPVEPVHQKIRIVLINNCSASIYVKRHTMATWGKILCIHIYIYIHILITMMIPLLESNTTFKNKWSDWKANVFFGCNVSVNVSQNIAWNRCFFTGSDFNGDRVSWQRSRNGWLICVLIMDLNDP